MGTEPTGQDEPRSGGSPQPDEWDGLVLDEDFVRGAEVSEPAARTRMLTARWRRQAPTPQPWRSDQPPAGWIHGTPGKRRGRPERPRRRRWFRRKGKGDSA